VVTVVPVQVEVLEVLGLVMAVVMARDLSCRCS
jgi:hypothetical protein